MCCPFILGLLEGKRGCMMVDKVLKRWNLMVSFVSLIDGFRNLTCLPFHTDSTLRETYIWRKAQGDVADSLYKEELIGGLGQNPRFVYPPTFTFIHVMLLSCATKLMQGNTLSYISTRLSDETLVVTG